MDQRLVAERTPMPAQRGPVSTAFVHASGGGFCTICGTVWPCSQAGRTASS